MIHKMVAMARWYPAVVARIPRRGTTCRRRNSYRHGAGTSERRAGDGVRFTTDNHARARFDKPHKPAPEPAHVATARKLIAKAPTRPQR
jgi:hypothetical protein